MSDYTTTAGALTASVRLLGDYDNQNQSQQYVSDGFLMQRTSANYKVAYELLAAADPDRLTTTSGTLLGQTTGSFPLPADLYRLRAVDVLVGNQYLRLLRDDPSPLNSPWELPFGTSVPGLTGVPARYRLQGGSVYVAPDAQAGSQFRVTYIPCPVALTGSDQVVDAPAGTDELTVWRTVFDCRIREDRETAEAERHIAAETKRISDMARDRDSGQPHRLEDPMTSRIGRMWRRGSFR